MKNVVIVGVGALGSHAAMLLRNVEASLKLVDFDRIEMKNVLSQLHGKSAVGKNKAQALQQVMNFLFGVKVDAVPHKLSKDNVEALLGKADLVLDCVDNAEARTVIQTFVRARSIACLHGGLSAAAAQYGIVRWDENFTIDSEVGVGAATCEDGGHLPFIAIVASYLAKSAQEFLQTGKKVSWDVHAAGVIKT